MWIRKFVIIVVVFFVIGTINLTAESFNSEKPTLAVLPFEGAGGVLQTDATAIYELFITKMILINKFNVVERSMIDKLIGEQGFALSDFSNNKDVVKLGELLASEWVVIGSISRIGSRYSMVVRLVNVNSGISEEAGSIQSNSIESLADKLDSLVNMISGKAKMIDYVANPWGVEVLSQLMMMSNEIYAYGVSAGIQLKESKIYSTGIYGGVLMKPNMEMYFHGGIKLVYYPIEDLGICVNIGVLPGVGVYYKNIYAEYSPLHLLDYNGFGATLGYRFNF